MYRHSVSAAAVVFNEQSEILLIQRADNGHWQIPGGVVEQDESPTEAAHREVMEEAGVEIDNLALSGVYKNTAVGVIALVFAANYKGGQPRTSPESTQVGWFSAEDALNLVDTTFAARIRDALEPHQAVPFRMHDGHRFIPAP